MLYFIPTPIGNKEDITLRGLRLLKELHTFFCEDTGRFKDLCRLYDIDYTEKKLYAYTSFTDPGRLQHFINLLSSQDCGVVSEAWTPGLSDPWKSLIKLCREHNIPFDILPGATALVPAVVWAYCDTSSFSYYWFLPPKKWRQTMIKDMMSQSHPCILYESVHRIEKLITELDSLHFTWQVGIFRELSKKFEQKVRWTVADIKTKISSWDIAIKGEFVVILYPEKV